MDSWVGLTFWPFEYECTNACASVSNSLGYILRNGIAGSVLNFLRNFCTIVAVSFYSPSNSARGLSFLHILTSSCCFVFLIVTFLMYVRLLSQSSICISLVMWFANIFPPIFGLPFTLPVVSLMCRRFKLWYVFSFVACAFGVISKKSLPNPVSWSFPPMVSLKVL